MKIIKIGRWLSSGILAILILLLLFLLISPWFGWHFGSVISGSMEPALKKGAMIIAQPVSLGEIKKGDVITFQIEKNSPSVVHRVLRIIQKDGEIFFQTKGDAAEAPDSWLIGKSELHGKVVFHLPYFGGFASFLKTKGIYPFLLMIPALMLMVILTRDLWKLDRG